MTSPRFTPLRAMLPTLLLSSLSLFAHDIALSHPTPENLKPEQLYSMLKPDTDAIPRIVFECRTNTLSALLIMDSVYTNGEATITYELAPPFTPCNFYGYVGYQLSDYYQSKLAGNDFTHTLGPSLLNTYQAKLVKAFQNYQHAKHVALTAGGALFAISEGPQFITTGTYTMQCLNQHVQFIQIGDRARYTSNWTCPLPNYTEIGEIQALELDHNHKPASNVDMGLIDVPALDNIHVFETFPQRFKLTPNN